MNGEAIADSWEPISEAGDTNVELFCRCPVLRGEIPRPTPPPLTHEEPEPCRSLARCALRSTTGSTH